MHHPTGSAPIVVCALYKFVTLENFEALRRPLLEVMLQQDVKGTLLLAKEGPLASVLLGGLGPGNSLVVLLVLVPRAA